MGVCGVRLSGGGGARGARSTGDALPDAQVALWPPFFLSFSRQQLCRDKIHPLKVYRPVVLGFSPERNPDPPTVTSLVAAVSTLLSVHGFAHSGHSCSRWSLKTDSTLSTMFSRPVHGAAGRHYLVRTDIVSHPSSSLGARVVSAFWLSRTVRLWACVHRLLRGHLRSCPLGRSPGWGRWVFPPVCSEIAPSTVPTTAAAPFLRPHRRRAGLQCLLPSPTLAPVCVRPWPS